jgi:hypothetical protein
VSELFEESAMTTGVTEDTQVSTTTHELSANDRCDSCGAQAYIRATLPAGGELLFCAHHGRKNHDKLIALGASWHDESERLVEPRF